jgi:hypothetical protein
MTPASAVSQIFAPATGGAAIAKFPQPNAAAKTAADKHHPNRSKDFMNRQPPARSKIRQEKSRKCIVFFDPNRTFLTIPRSLPIATRQ